MASIFTFDPDPPRVSSPWSAYARSYSNSEGASTPRISIPGSPMPHALQLSTTGNLDDEVITRLAAEPQEGPTEYKLHLLLRPRRSLLHTGTSQHVSGSRQFRSGLTTPRSVSDTSSAAGPSTPNIQAAGYRQHRLEQLTTQLLWRLQQSSPYHSAVASNLILPSLPEATPELRAPQEPANLLPGLEQSKGALYEIGVADDGTFVGLIEEEMTESLNNLRAMAFSLGCSVKILRMVEVGECEWSEQDGTGSDLDQVKLRIGKLYVAEAYVKPYVGNSLTDAIDMHESHDAESGSPRQNGGAQDGEAGGGANVGTRKEQLRVSFSGATTCGKSSLLGTLSTSTLDNGRGKSRLSLLKHRHEIASGMTSSVAQELIGYSSDIRDTAVELQTSVINYATGNVTSWDDIHASSDSGRLAFLSDCAGHPRYRRTTVRGLVGWAPHWTLLCIAANDAWDPQSQDGTVTPESDGLDFPGAYAHISMAHLDLCLKLELPLVVVITKLDVASKTGFRQILSTLLTSLKSAGRKPSLLSNDNCAISERDLQVVPQSDDIEVSNLVDTLRNDSVAIVPIVFTSAVKGTGIGKLHALLQHLPIPRPVESDDQSVPEDAQILFHIDDSFVLDLSKGYDTTHDSSQGFIVSGHLAAGSIQVGDEVSIGPFSLVPNSCSDETEPRTASYPQDGFLSPRSFNDALLKAISSPSIRAVSSEREWQRVKIVSIRNLRLPVRSLYEDQVGTIGVIPVENSASPLLIRKGMVLASGKPSAAHAFTASFEVEEASSVVVGSLVVVYCASVRASAKVIAISLQRDRDDSTTSFPTSPEHGGVDEDGTDDAFTFELDDNMEKPSTQQDVQDSILVTFQFISCREWVEIGSRVLIMPGGGHGGSDRGVKGLGGLEGFVGIIVQQFR